MINSRNIDDLHPTVAKMARAFIAACEAQGIHLLVTSTYRDFESQNALYAVGRVTKGSDASPRKPMGSTVTNAKGGQSYHNWRVALDVVPLVNGKAIWNDTALWNKVGQIGKACGLEWAGDWKTFRETPHFQYTAGLHWTDFQAGKTLPA